MLMVEYSLLHKYHYDGVSEHMCTNCGRRTGRWCGNVLHEDEVEPRYCQGGEHPKREEE